MAQAFDWRNDPIVHIEQQVEHVVPLCAMWLADLATHPDADHRDLRTDILANLERAKDCFFDAGKTVFTPMDVETPDDIAELCVQTAAILGDLTVKVTAIGDQPDRAKVAELSKFLRLTARPAVQTALDGLRATFITTIVHRQNSQKKQATLAIKQVRDISKKIFFISINASVEAARVGDAGKGFSMISQEIRSLSQTAKAAVDDLSNATD